MEYKEDEEYNFTQAKLAGSVLSWPATGMPSGVYLQNPGMSIWVFIILAKIFRVTSPTELATAVQIFSLLGICLIIPFALKIVDQAERKPWLWAFALAMVNPLAVFYQRKLWPEPFLPFFTMLTLIGWWRREKYAGAFIWGLIGAFLGQIHMSGFFFAAGLFLWTAIFGKHTTMGKTSTRWGMWLLGSAIGALPLIPWAMEVIRHPPSGRMVSGFSEILQLKFWVFWVSNPLGLHLGNPLGLLLGESNLAQLSDFIRYPLLQNGSATYLVGLAHLLVILVGCTVLVMAAKNIFTNLRSSKTTVYNLITGTSSSTNFVQNAALIGFGLLLTLTGVNIRRYYMMIAFPLEYIWLARAVKSHRLLLGTLFLLHVFISTAFVAYIHVNEGAPHGDYGHAYHVVMKNRAKNN